MYYNLKSIISYALECKDEVSPAPLTCNNLEPTIRPYNCSILAGPSGRFCKYKWRDASDYACPGTTHGLIQENCKRMCSNCNMGKAIALIIIK